jgi:hypothetical protein
MVGSGPVFTMKKFPLSDESEYYWLWALWAQALILTDVPGTCLDTDPVHRKMVGSWCGGIDPIRR